MYNKELITQSYVNPRAPVHILSGIAGVCGGYDAFTEPAEPWQAFRDLTDQTGFATVQVFNSTTIAIQQRNGETGKIIDSFTLVQETHGPF